MLKCFVGDDYTKIKQETEKLKKTTSSGDAVLMAINSFSKQEIDNLCNQGLLFSQKRIIILNDVITEQISEEFGECLATMSQSSDIFIVKQEELTPALKKKITKHCEVVTFSKEKEQINIFSLTDLFAKRERFRCWDEYTKLIKGGIDPTQICGILEWQIKTLLSVRAEDTPEKLNMKPFVFSKAKKYSQNFSENDLLFFLKNITKARYSSRKTSTPLGVYLEYIILLV